MAEDRSIAITGIRADIKAKVSDYLQLMKVRLSFLVVFSAAMAYLWAVNRLVDPLTIWLLSSGGFLVTGAANTLNQVIERGSDKLMKRTCNRPLSSGRMEASEALIFATVTGLAGLALLSEINLTCSLLCAAAAILYAVVYTPLKKVNYFAILPGAVAGSLPVVIGCVAAAGRLTMEAGMLFALQLIWQFPHTWSIAWLLDEEYKKAGIRMMPAGGTNKTSAVIILISTFLIIPACLLLHMYCSAGIGVTWLMVAAGFSLTMLSYRLCLKPDRKSALGLMFGSFAYLPFVLIVIVIAKFI